MNPAPVMRPEPVGFWRGPVARRSWTELLYLFVNMPLFAIGLAYAITTVALGASLAVTVVGLAACAALVLGARGLGGLHRAAARAMLGVDVPAPPAPRHRPGFFGWLWGSLVDSAGWRALAFLVLLPVPVVVGFAVSLSLVAAGLGSATLWIWSRWLPAQQAPDGSWHRGAQFGSGYFVDTPPRLVLAAAAGVVLLWLWPPVTRGLVHVVRLLVQSLLSPTRTSLRVADLESTRRQTVAGADDRLRHIERDLHDGTQARLVALAMTLGDAKDRLGTASSGAPASGPREVDEVRELIDAAHLSAKEALVELRDIARGIHPPVLDAGLPTALETLAARSPLPVSVDCDLPERPAPAIETIAYYCAAELVTNAVKHAGAGRVLVLAHGDGDRLRLRVRDDGAGGARLSRPDGAGHGTGLQGLADRVRAVDGTLGIDSPAGGPTVVTVTLPLALGAGAPRGGVSTAVDGAAG